jgi:hypothetical protein
MARIICRTPSTGKPLRITLKDVSDTFTVVAEAPDFSVPDSSEKFTERDPADSTRAIRPGEIFFLTPMAVKNKSTTSSSIIELQLITEDNITIELGKLEIPAGDTGFFPLQGRSLLKRDLTSVNGDRIRIKASISGIFDIWAAAEEKLSSEHSGVGEV